MSYKEETVQGLHSFIKQTPEGNLRKMLVDSSLTDAHFRLLMKLAKGASEADFIDAFQNESVGKLRLNAKEMPLKETLWPVCKKKFIALGLLPKEADGTKTPQSAAA